MISAALPDNIVPHEEQIRLVRKWLQAEFEPSKGNGIELSWLKCVAEGHVRAPGHGRLWIPQVAVAEAIKQLGWRLRPTGQVGVKAKRLTCIRKGLCGGNERCLESRP